MKKQNVHEIRRGMLVVRITARLRKGRSRHRLDLFRLFKNGDQWKKSRRFCPDDIPLMRLLLDEAYGWILIQQQVHEGKSTGEKSLLPGVHGG